MINESIEKNSGRWLLYSFLAGFLATLLFHQLMIALLRGLRVMPLLPYSMVPTEPFGIPAALGIMIAQQLQRVHITGGAPGQSLKEPDFNIEVALGGAAHFLSGAALDRHTNTTRAVFPTGTGKSSGAV